MPRSRCLLWALASRVTMSAHPMKLADGNSRRKLTDIVGRLVVGNMS
jgi:hypothetical protein